MLEYIIVVILIVLIWNYEHMTTIRRTVGVQNSANETQIASGIVNSVPIMDYTHTYWDGAEITSCDECPSPIVCGECYAPPPKEEFTQPIIGDIPYDLPRDYTTSREVMGAVRNRCSKAPAAKISCEVTAGREEPLEIRRTERHWDKPLKVYSDYAGLMFTGPAGMDKNYYNGAYQYKEI
jgi:hypothetical protein